MREVVKKKWSELSRIWHNIDDNNVNTTPYQSYEFLTFTGKGKPQRSDLFRLLGLKELNLILYVNGQAVAIAPLLIKRHGKTYNVFLRGHFTVAHQLDFIYMPDISYDDFVFLLDSIKEILGQVSFVLTRISEKSVSFEYLKKYFASERIDRYECVMIPVPDSYSDWLNSLHKSRQKNIRNHENRLKRDNVKLHTAFYCGKPVDKATSKKIMLVYAGRFLSKNHFHFGPFTGFVKWILQFCLLRDKMTQWMNTAPNNFHAILYINDEVAAFTSGLICKDKRISSSRLAISDRFSKYAPGGVLLCAVMKYLTEQNKCGALEIEFFDMSRGGKDGGMSYKYSFGGKTFFDFDFIGSFCKDDAAAGQEIETLKALRK